MAGTEFDGEKIIRYFNDERPGTDSSYIDEVFCDNSKEKELKDLLSRQFNELPAGKKPGKNLDHILYRIHYEINTHTAAGSRNALRNIIKWAMRVAAILIVPLTILFYLQTSRQKQITRDTWVEIKAPAWTRARFSLPDGTTGWLNSNSSVKYKGNFISDRKITLSGEAFFDVYKDKKRPFKVNTNDVLVRVLGTRFSIASYENEQNVEVVLEEGKLEVQDKEMSKTLLLKPNDLVVYDKAQKNFSSQVVQPQKYVSWTEGKLVFRNDPLDVIARRLERWYNIEVEVNVPDTEDLRLRATFIDESLEEVLSLLKRSLPINYIIENRGLDPDETYIKKKVIITSKNQ